jgi:hypothetical protein
MKAITTERYEQAIAASSIKPKFVRELRPKFDLVTDWEDREFLPITNRSGNEGILWVEHDEHIYLLPYSLSRGIVDKASGRARPVICDLCYTQQLGTAAARIGFAMPGRAGASRSLLCCANLDCNEHVRGTTKASLRSKAQLRESISVEDRILRLRRRLGELLDLLEAQAISS